MHPDIITAAERQFGLVTRDQLQDKHLSRDQIKRLQRQRRIEEIRPRVYRIVGTPHTWEQGLLAVLLCAGPAVASHACGRAVYTVPFGRAPYEITTTQGRQVRLAGVRAHRSDLWLPEDETSRAGIPVCSPERLVLDQSGRLDARQLGRLVDELLRRGLLRLDRLALTRGRFNGARGRRPSVVDEVLVARLTGYVAGDSNLEAHIIRAIQAAGLPMPTAQQRIEVRGAHYRIDLSYPEHMIAIEIDSWAYHQWRSTFDRDRAKRNDLTLLGFNVLQVTDGMTDHAIVELIGRALLTFGQVGAGIPSASHEQRAG